VRGARQSIVLRDDWPRSHVNPFCLDLTLYGQARGRKTRKTSSKWRGERYNGRVRNLAPVALALWGAGCAPAAPEVQQDEQGVVYGADSRMEYYAHPDPTLRARTLESTVALVRPSRVDMSNPNALRIDHRTLGEDEDLCVGEAFFDQQVGASCSGTLVDWDLVLTAGHCVDDLAECQARLFVFDLFYEAPGQLANIGPQDVFQCRKIVARRNSGDIDYALVQLDRPVTAPRRPAPVSMLDMPLTLGSSVSVVGFPDGIPAKLDSEGVVIIDGTPDLEAFDATLDTFGGNSGSGVYNAEGVLVGNLARGQTDYVRNGACWVVNQLPAEGDNGDGEEVVYVARALEGLCDTAGWRPALRRPRWNVPALRIGRCLPRRLELPGQPPGPCGDSLRCTLRHHDGLPG